MKNYVVIDFETTGLDYKTEQITEVALIKYDPQFNEIGSFNSLVKLDEGRVLSDFIKNLTGLTEEALSHGMNQHVVWYMIDQFIDSDTIVVAQYAPFDLAYMEYQGGIIVENFICTKSLTSQVEPTLSSSLKPTCERLGIKLDNAHRAFADVRATAEVLQYRLSQPEIQLVENYIVKSPDRDLNFIPYNTIEVLEKSQFIKEEI
jgi:DNA polymerase-3 subunit epsilon